MAAPLSGNSVLEALEPIDTATTIAQLERAFLDSAPRLIDADAFGICWLDATGRMESVRAVNVPRGMPEQYESFGREKDSLWNYLRQQRAAVHDQVLFTRRAWAREAVCEFLSDFGFEGCLQAPVVVRGSLRSTLHCTRAPGGRRFTGRDLRAAVLVRRHIERRLDWVLAERELERTRAVCLSLLEEFPAPAVITTASGALVHANRAAASMLLTYRAIPALHPEYETVVRRNVQLVVTSGGAARETGLAGHTDALRYRVHTSSVAERELFLSVFHPAGSEHAERPALAPKELMIANLVAQGYTNERIAAALSVSVNTVKDHLKRINRKLGTGNRAQLAAWAQVAIGAG